MNKNTTVHMLQIPIIQKVELPKTRCGILSLRSELLEGKFIVGNVPYYMEERRIKQKMIK